MMSCDATCCSVALWCRYIELSFMVLFVMCHVVLCCNPWCAALRILLSCRIAVFCVVCIELRTFCCIAVLCKWLHFFSSCFVVLCYKVLCNVYVVGRYDLFDYVVLCCRVVCYT